MQIHFVKPCPECGSQDIKLLNAFDFKFRVACLACGHATAWHLHDPQLAVAEWNNPCKEKDKQ